MKRTFERILFMIIGALIAFCAYLIGHIDSDLNAQDGDKVSTFDALFVKQLIVSHSILVGNKDNNVFLSSVNSNPTLRLNSKKNDSEIGLSLLHNQAELFMETAHHNDHRTSIRMNTAFNNNGKKEVPEIGGTPYSAKISIGHYKHKEGGVNIKDFFSFAIMNIVYIKDKLGTITGSHPISNLQKGDHELRLDPGGVMDD